MNGERGADGIGTIISHDENFLFLLLLVSLSLLIYDNQIKNNFPFILIAQSNKMSSFEETQSNFLFHGTRRKKAEKIKSSYQELEVKYTFEM